jgi:hypothetical protein
MASTPGRKRTRARPATRPRRVADLTTHELRKMIGQLIEDKLAEFDPRAARVTESIVTVQMRQRAVAAAGRFHSGYSNISDKHDEHLATSYLG